MLINPFRAVTELYARGGLEIATPERGSPLLLRTVVQPDGDLITHVSEAVLRSPEVWEEHFRRVASAGHVLDVLRRAVNVVSWGAVLVWLSQAAFLLWKIGAQDISGRSLFAHAAVFSVGLLLGTLRASVVSFARFRIRQALRS